MPSDPKAPSSIERAPATRPFSEQPFDPMPSQGPEAPPASTFKVAALAPFRDAPRGAALTTDHGLPIAHTDDSLKAGVRGPSLLEDSHFREKITRFDHERIPERVVHARGAGAHGYFQLYEPLPELSRARLFNDTSFQTPVFVRFSTVVGSRGSADTVRDVRGFATKFYTPEGNFDLVGNNMPVFFIQDGIKFPDIVHAAKPEPANEIPQAQSAHDTFWYFVSLVPESAHMVMWVMSDRAIPRSYRMMEGFGVHTFRLIDARGGSRLVKFHWRPVLGAHSLVWDEAQKLAGKDPDFHRRDLWNAIETGAFPEFELGVQIMEEGEELKYGFDLLDSTKLIPEELVPVRRIGKMVLNRNPQNFFAETEQVAFHLGNLVPGIEVTDDPLLQARLFSYLDTQLTRLGGPNFAEIPINRPIVAVANHQQDGFHRDTINTGNANYHPNSIGSGCPFLAGDAGFVHRSEKLHGHTVRARSESFRDHFSQAAMFVASQSPAERLHLTEALRFELGKVTRKAVRSRMLGVLREIDPTLAEEVSIGIGVPVPEGPVQVPPGTSAPGPRGDNGGITASPALSLANQPKASIATRKIALLAAAGYDEASAEIVRKALVDAGAIVEVIAPVLGPVPGAAPSPDKLPLEADKTFKTAASVFYDAVLVADGEACVTALEADGDAVHFIQEAYKHHKAIAAIGAAADLVVLAEIDDAVIDDTSARASGAAASAPAVVSDLGVVTARDPGAAGELAAAFITAIAQHRHWDRDVAAIPA
ncbi:MAG TPA: catalase [Kofleriaceae bacterium]|nr:catalase [Kofleriaceae bacterium]